MLLRVAGVGLADQIPPRILPSKPPAGFGPVGFAQFHRLFKDPLHAGVIAEHADGDAILEAKDLRASLSRLPVQHAGLPEETAATLMQMGLRTLGQVLDAPRHPYTRGLLESMPARAQPGDRLPQIEGMAPSLAARPVGCAFRPRCPNAITRCAEQAPSLVQEGDRSHRCYAPIPIAAHTA